MNYSIYKSATSDIEKYREAQVNHQHQLRSFPNRYYVANLYYGNGPNFPDSNSSILS